MAATTVTTTPNEMFAPYQQSAAQSLQNAATAPYQAYTGARVAGNSPLENQAYNTAANYNLPSQFNQASQVYNKGINALLNADQYVPQQITSGYTAGSFNPTGSGGYTAGQTFGGVFDNAAAQQYMSPYQQNVTDIAKRETERDFQKQQAQLRARMGAAGAFGGSRATLLETENQRNQNQLLSDIQTKGLQDAYMNAQQQFGADRDARMKAFGLNEDAKQFAAQFGLDATKMNEANLQQQASMGMDAQRLSEANRLSAAQLLQSGAQSALSGAQGLAQLGVNMDATERARIAQLSELGLQQRAQQQAGLDANYEMYKDARDYNMQRAKDYASGIAGLASGYGTVNTDTPDPSTLATVFGGLSSGLGLLGQLGGKEGGIQAGFDQLKSVGGELFNWAKGFFNDDD